MWGKLKSIHFLCSSLHKVWELINLLQKTKQAKHACFIIAWDVNIMHDIVVKHFSLGLDFIKTCRCTARAQLQHFRSIRVERLQKLLFPPYSK